MPNLRQFILFIFFINSGITCLLAQDKAQLETDQQVYNFGSIEESKGLASHVFKISNNGQKPLVISRVTASCGCTKPEWTKEPIPAGQTGLLKITYNPKGRPGPFYKTITIFSNAEKSRYNLAIKGNVIQTPAAPKFVYPYAIGNLKMHTKNILFNNLRQNESLGEKISIKNEGKTSIKLDFGKTPDYLIVDSRPASISPDETGEITFLIDGRKIKNKGRLNLDIPITVKAAGEKSITESITFAANVIDDFSKMSAREKAKGPVIHLSGSLFDFGKIPSKRNKIPFIKTKLTGTVEISNKGKSNLIIHSFTSDNDIVIINRGKKEIKPGESTIYKVSIHPKDVKVRLDALINIICNDPNGPVRLLKVTAHK